MKNRVELRRVLTVAGACVLSAMAGCGEKEAPKPKNSGGGMAAPADPKPRASAASIKTHPKVQFPDERMPDSPEMAQAIADLAAAIASGSADGLKAIASPADRLVLEMLVASGEWKRRSDAVKVVRVCVINQPVDGPMQVGLGVQDSSGAFLMGWTGADAGGAWSFANMPIEPRVAADALALDGAELKILALPQGLPAADTMMKPAEEKKEGEEKKDKPKAPKSKPGTLTPDRF